MSSNPAPKAKRGGSRFRVCRTRSIRLADYGARPIGPSYWAVIGFCPTFVRPLRYDAPAMLVQPTPLPRPRESFTLLCVRCGSPLYYVRQDRARGVFEHRFDCRRCGRKHAAWSYDWEPGDSSSAGA